MSCKSQKARSDLLTTDDIKNVQKAAQDTLTAIQGQNNKLDQINDNSQTTLTMTQKMVESTLQQIQSGQGVTAKQIKEMQTKINNTHNSTILMGIIIAIMAVIILILIGVIFWVIRKLFSIKTMVKRIIQSPENDYSYEKHKELLNV
jgi:cobalamin biosynthesis Mg chelatase CobN